MLNKEDFLKLIEYYPNSLNMQDSVTFFFYKNGIELNIGRCFITDTHITEQFYISFGGIKHDITKEDFTKIKDVFNKKQCEKVKELLESPKKEVEKEKVEWEKSLKERVKGIKDLLIEEDLHKNRILVVDLNYLLSEYKNSDIDTIKSLLKNEYKYEIFLIDTSRTNIQGSSNLQPVFFIECLSSNTI